MLVFHYHLFQTVSVPLGYPHTVTEDVKLEQYIIPRNTLVLFHLQAAHNDHTYWKRPQEFRPDRFLEENGEEIKHECFFPFSVGENYMYSSILITRFLIGDWIQTIQQRVVSDVPR